MRVFVTAVADPSVDNFEGQIGNLIINFPPLPTPKPSNKNTSQSENNDKSETKVEVDQKIVEKVESKQAPAKAA